MNPILRRGARAALVAFGLTALIYLAQWVHLLNIVGIDAALERQFLNVASRTVDRAAAELLRIIYIDETSNGPLESFADPIARQKWRARHARLLLALEAAGARAVAFDLTFSPAITDFSAENAEFASAITQVRARGRTRVLVGYGSDPDYDRAIAEAIPCADMGLVQIARRFQDIDGKLTLGSVLLGDANVKRVGDTDNAQLRRPLPMGLALYLAARAGATDIVEPAIDMGRRQLVFFGNVHELAPIDVDVRDAPSPPSRCTPTNTVLSTHRMALLPVWMGEGTPFVERSYASVALQPQLSDDWRDKVVLVGARVADDVVAVGPESGQTWGYQVHARVFADLWSGTYLRHVGDTQIFLALLLLLIVGAVAGLLLPKTEVKTNVPWIGSMPIPVGLLLVAGIHAFVLIQLLRYRYQLFDIGYQWLALIAGYYVVSRQFKPGTNPPEGAAS